LFYRRAFLHFDSLLQHILPSSPTMSSSRGIAYEKVSTDTDSSSDGLLSRRREGEWSTSNSTFRQGVTMLSRTPKLAILIIVPFATLLLVVIFGGVLLKRTWKPSLRQITISTRIPPDFCGNSPAEAIAAGCKFEANNFAWQHPWCYNEEQEQDWRHGEWSSDIEFWENHDENWNGVGRIDNEEAFKGLIPLVWVNTLQHRRHCLQVWRKYVEAASDQMPLDAWTVDRPHVLHCMRILRDFNNTWPDEMVSSKLTLKYPACEFGPVAINISPNKWTPQQIRLHSP
jgi:hypothetical protein